MTTRVRHRTALVVLILLCPAANLYSQSAELDESWALPAAQILAAETAREQSLLPVLPEKKPKKKKKKIKLNYGIVAGQPQGEIRTSGARVGVDYEVTGRHSVGVETRHAMYDRQDAAAWDKDGEDEDAAEVKYKLSF